MFKLLSRIYTSKEKEWGRKLAGTGRHKCKGTKLCKTGIIRQHRIHTGVKVQYCVVGPEGHSKGVAPSG